MSKAKRARKRRTPAEAYDEIVVYMPRVGYVKVGELKTKLAAEVKPKVTVALEGLEKAVAAKVVEKGGRLTRSELGEVLMAVKQERGTKRGVTLSRLIRDGILARIKVPGMRAFYAVTEEGARKAGIVK